MKEKILKRIEIYPKIISELKKSEREILIVSDWLTEENIFDVLIEKQEQGVKVKLILEDYVNSKALKFSNLRKAGGEIYKIEKNNFGLMHKRYCVIDEKIAVFTLANWSPYVLVQGHESLIVTGHTKTIKNFKVHFSQIMSKATRTGRKKTENSIIIRIINWILKPFKIKSKVGEKQTEIHGEADVKLKKEYKMIKPSGLLDDVANKFFFRRN